MQYQINVERRNIAGKRPNLAGQNSVADEIVSALSPEEMPLPPLSPLPPTSPHPPRKRNPQGAAIAGAILVLLPFLYPVAFFVNGFTSGRPLPLLMYPLLVLMARFLANVGSFILYLAARAANHLRKVIGWVSLAAFVLPIAATFLFGGVLYRIDPRYISQTRGWIGLACVAVALLCMLALCVFSVLLLVRVFRKQTPPSAE